MSKLKNIYFVSDTGAAFVTAVDVMRVGAKEALIKRMEAIGYQEATYQEYRQKRAWQRRQEQKERSQRAE